MKIYIDSDFKCHTTNPDGNYKEVETDFFDGKCDAYIELTRFVPMCETWVREDGAVFSGEMVSPWKNSNERENAQREYEKQLLADYESALAEIEAALGV